MRITLADSAVRDLEGIVAYHKKKGVPDVGADLVAENLDRIETLSDHPDIGRIVPEFENTRLREIVHAPFRIVYRRDSDMVRVVRIWRSEGLLQLPRD